MNPRPAFLAFALAVVVALCVSRAKGAEATQHSLARLQTSGSAALAFSADGGALLTAGGHEARVWDAHTWRPLTEPLRHEQEVKAAALSPDGKEVVTAAGTEAVLWDVATGWRLLTLRHPDRVLDAAFSPDGKRLATACLDRTARDWDAANGDILGELRHEDPVRSVAFSPDGKRLLTGTVMTGSDPAQLVVGRNEPINVNDPVAPGDAHVWDVARRQLLWSFYEAFYCCRGRPVYSPDGKWVGVPTGSSGVFVCDARNGERLEDRVMPMNGDFTMVGFGRAGKRLLAAGWEGPSGINGAAVVAELKDREPGRHEPLQFDRIRGFGVMGSLASAAISPDGRRVGLGARPGGRRGVTGVWDVDTGRQVLKLDEAEQRSGLILESGQVWRVVQVAFSPDGSLVAFALQAIKGTAAQVGVWRVPGNAR